MADLGRMAATPIEIELDEQKYYISPLKLKDMGVLEEWSKQRIIKGGFDKIKLLEKSGVKVDNDLKLSILNEAIDSSKDAYSQGKELEGIDGLTKIFELAIRIKHPNIATDDVQKIIDAHGLDVLNKMIDQISYPNEEESEELKKPLELQAVKGKQTGVQSIEDSAKDTVSQ